MKRREQRQPERRETAAPTLPAVPSVRAQGGNAGGRGTRKGSEPHALQIGEAIPIENVATLRRTGKKARLAARLTEAQKQELEAAADEQGLSLTAFVLKATRYYHRKVQQKRRTIRLSERDQHAFVSAILEPPPPNPVLQAAMQRFREQYGQV